MPGPAYKYDSEHVIQNIGDLKENYDIGQGLTVKIYSYRFWPTTIIVKVGSTVTWTAKDATQIYHLLDETSGAGDAWELSSGFILAGTANDSYSHTFNTLGTFHYNCDVHPSSETGIVKVVSELKASIWDRNPPISRIVPGPSSLRGRSTAYTPSKGGNPSDMGK